MATADRQSGVDARETQNRKLYDRICSGDRGAINELIEANSDRVKTLARNFIYQRGQFFNLEDELVAAGNLALVEAANLWAGKHKPIRHIGACLSKIIARTFPEVCDLRECFGPGHSTRERNAKAKKKRRFPKSRRLYVDRSDGYDAHSIFSVMAEDFTEAGPSRLSNRSSGKRELAAADDDLRRSFLLGEVSGRCRDNTDRRIVELRAGGMTDAEVAVELQLSEKTIGTRRRAMEKSFATAV